MKDSGIEWFGEIPAGWKKVRIGGLYMFRNTKVNDRDYPPLSVTMKGILPQLETAAKSNAHDDRKLVCKGDFVINSRSDRRGSCGISSYYGSVSLINTVLAPRSDMNPVYYNWLFHTTEFSDEFYKWGHGIVDDLWTTGWQEMKKIFIPVPPLSEQNAIANFLDKKCAEIDKLTADIKTQIEVLENYKHSIITETVTKGLNPNVEMKDSGVEWIGKIPKNWELKRVKYAALLIYKGNGITKDDVVVDGDVPCVRYGEIYSKYSYVFNKCVTRTNFEKVSSPQFFSYGDILFAGTGELVEEIGKSIVYMGHDRCLAGGDIIILKHSQDPLYFGYALASIYAQSQKSAGKAKLKVVHISASDIGNIITLIPPYEEQVAIGRFIYFKCAEIDKIITSKNKQLAALEEYKKSLIYEYVTGKKSV